jgi:hypothetical protein
MHRHSQAALRDAGFMVRNPALKRGLAVKTPPCGYSTLYSPGRLIKRLTAHPLTLAATRADLKDVSRLTQKE